MPQLNVRSISVVPALALPASHLNTGSGVQLAASIAARRCAGSTRGRFSSRPPPVMWERASTLPARMGGKHDLMYSFVGVSSASAT
eukprot:4008054-Prymnesium_polylepis.1